MPRPTKLKLPPQVPVCIICGLPAPNRDDGICRVCKAKCGNANNGAGNHEYVASLDTGCVCRFCGREMKSNFRALD